MPTTFPGTGASRSSMACPSRSIPLAEPEYPFAPLADGDVLQVGSVRIRVVHTPGHRPEHCAFVVEDEQVVLTGDSLFVGDAARPDLAVAAREGARDLFHSLARLSELDDAVQVYPGHVAGSLCGTAMSPDHSSTIGRERGDESRSRLRRRAGVRARDVLRLDAEAADHRAGRGPQPWPVGRPPRPAAELADVGADPCSTCARSRPTPPGICRVR